MITAQVNYNPKKQRYEAKDAETLTVLAWGPTFEGVRKQAESQGYWVSYRLSDQRGK